mmetsp:Transcript_132430/g.264213  ORF Transcript_132430/g.264213 Transcript_132430/m.264213 type:complete len:410 (+) Transcript_132430:144-1373(+)
MLQLEEQQRANASSNSPTAKAAQCRGSCSNMTGSTLLGVAPSIMPSLTALQPTAIHAVWPPVQPIVTTQAMLQPLSWATAQPEPQVAPSVQWLPQAQPEPQAPSIAELPPQVLSGPGLCAKLRQSCREKRELRTQCSVLATSLREAEDTMRRMRQDWRMLANHLESIRWGLEVENQQAADASHAPSRGGQHHRSSGCSARRSSKHRHRHSRGVSESPGKFQPATEAAAAPPAIRAEASVIAEAKDAAAAAATCQPRGLNRCSSVGPLPRMILARAPETSPEEPSVIEEDHGVLGRGSKAASSTEAPESNLVEEHCMALELQLARANGCLASFNIDSSWPSIEGTPQSEDHSVNQTGIQHPALRRSVVTFADMTHFCSGSQLKVSELAGAADHSQDMAARFADMEWPAEL